MRVLACLGLVAMAGLTGCMSTASDVSATVQLAPREFAEVNLDLKKGGHVEWAWSTAPAHDVRFNVHSHSEGTLREHAVLETDHHEGSFEAPAAGGYSLLWENRGASNLSVTYLVEVDGRVVGTVP